MVITNKMMKYITRIGQNTGIFSASKNVQIIAMTMAFVELYLSNKKYKTHCETTFIHSCLMHLKIDKILSILCTEKTITVNPVNTKQVSNLGMSSLEAILKLSVCTNS